MVASPSFEHTYAEALPDLSREWSAAPVRDPRAVVVNDELARELGLDPDWLRSPEGLALLSGDTAETTYAQAYSGHQFGQFNPVLGDGRALLLGASALALGGCTQIPQSSDVRSAEPLDGATAAPEAPQFRPPGPSADDTAEDVIRGFLLAGTSPQDDYAVAREFLDGPAAARWAPGQRTLVYSAQPRITRGEGTGNYQVQVEVDSEIDEFGLRTIAPEGTTRAWQVSVQERPEGMRITATENGTLLSQSQFGQLFAPHELAFYDTAQRYAVPDVRWFVNRGTTVTAVTRALLRGPAPYLTGAVETAFPLRTGTDLAALLQQAKARADAAVAFADKTLANAKTDQAKARAEDLKQKAAAKAAEATTQFEAAQGDAKPKLDAAAAAKDAAKAAEAKKAATKAPAKKAAASKAAPRAIATSTARPRMISRRTRALRDIGLRPVPSSAASAGPVPALLEFTEAVPLPSAHGAFRALAVREGTAEHLVLVAGDVTGEEPVLTRVHSECVTGDVIGSLRCDCGPQLHESLARISAAGRGVLVLLRGHEGRGIGLVQKLRAYALQDAGRDTVEANLDLGLPVDERSFAAVPRILEHLGVGAIDLLTHNPEKADALRAGQLGGAADVAAEQAEQVLLQAGQVLDINARTLLHAIGVGEVAVVARPPASSRRSRSRVSVAPPAARPPRVTRSPRRCRAPS